MNTYKNNWIYAEIEPLQISNKVYIVYDSEMTYKTAFFLLTFIHFQWVNNVTSPLNYKLFLKCWSEWHFFSLGRKTCYKGWKLEYQGYLMAGNYGHQAGSQYTCVDSHPDTLHGGKADKNGKLFYFVEARCGSLKCPPYVEGRELVCVVCSKE